MCRWPLITSAQCSRLLALILGRAKQFVHFRVEGIMGTIPEGYFKFGPVVKEELSFKEKVYGPTTKEHR